MSADNADNLNGFRIRSVNYEIGVDDPNTTLRTDFVAAVANRWKLGEKLKTGTNVLSDAIGRIDAVLGDVFPNIEEVKLRSGS